MEQNNRVVISGRLCGSLEYSHSLYGEAFYSFKLEVRRLSGAIDLLPVTVSERLLQQLNICEREMIMVCGQLRSYNKITDGVSRLILTVFAQSICKDTSPECCNEVILTGYICKQPVYRTTPFQREICDMLIAINRAYNKSDYIPCIAWGRNARFAVMQETGAKITICGRFQSREYQKQNGGNIETRVAYEVSASKIECGS